MKDERLNNADIGMLFADLYNLPTTNMCKIATMTLRAVKTFSEPVVRDGRKAFGVVNENRTPKAEGEE